MVDEVNIGVIKVAMVGKAIWTCMSRMQFDEVLHDICCPTVMQFFSITSSPQAHFTADQFLPTLPHRSLRKLKPGAVPTIFSFNTLSRDLPTKRGLLNSIKKPRCSDHDYCIALSSDSDENSPMKKAMKRPSLPDKENCPPAKRFILPKPDPQQKPSTPAVFTSTPHVRPTSNVLRQSSSSTMNTTPHR